LLVGVEIGKPMRRRSIFSAGHLDQVFNDFENRAYLLALLVPGPSGCSACGASSSKVARNSAQRFGIIALFLTSIALRRRQA